jgi:hypothetical protein
MWALVIAFLSVGGLVKFAWGQKVEPTLRPALRRAKLIRLAQTPESRLTLVDAEDGVVLSRQFDAPELERRFRAVAEKLKVAQRKNPSSKGSTP